MSREELAAAYKIVAKNIVTTPESKDMQELYTKFQAEYPLGDMTTATKMKDVFHELNEADCRHPPHAGLRQCGM